MLINEAIIRVAGSYPYLPERAPRLLGIRQEAIQMTIEVQIYRYHPEQDQQPRMQVLSLPDAFRPRMVLDALEYLHEIDPTLVFRRSCREGVCGSDGMNINGKNLLAW